MAEVIAVIGLAASVAQLVDIGFKVVARLAEVRHRATVTLQRHFIHIENQLPLLLHVLDAVAADAKTGKLGLKAQEILKRAIDGCLSQVWLLVQILDRLSAGLQSTWIRRSWKAVNNLKEEKQVAMIEKSLEQYKTTITLHLAHENATEGSQNQTPDRTPCFFVPARQISHFIGRQRYLDEIDRHLSASEKPREQPGIVVVHGMGGLGKTQLALAYCQRAWRNGDFHSIFWFDASNPETLVRSFERMIELISEDKPKFENNETKIAFVKATISKWPHPWLMIFDNFDQPAAFRDSPIQDAFPPSLHGAIMITSRHPDSTRLGIGIHINHMSEDEAVELLFSRSMCVKNPTNLTKAKQVVAQLAYLPLAIDQAAAYISVRRIDFAAFQDHYHNRKEIVLRHTPDLWEYRRFSTDAEKENSLSVFTTWDLSVLQLHNDHGERDFKLHFLTIGAFISNSEVRETIFRAYSESDRGDSVLPAWMQLFMEGGQWDRFRFEDVVAELCSLCLVGNFEHGDEGECRFILHPLVRDWIKLRQNEPQRQAYTREAIEILSHPISGSRVFDHSFSQRQAMLAHLDACVENDGTYLKSGDRLGWGSLRDPAIHFAAFYKLQARYKESKMLQQRLLEASEQEFGPTNLKTLDTALRLGKVLGKEGRYEEAELHVHRAFTGVAEALGPTHEESLQAAVELASIYFKQGRYRAAEPLLQRTMACQIQTLGPQNPQTLWTAMSLAMAYKKQARYAEAEDLYQQTLYGQEKQLGCNHPDFLKALMNLASVKIDLAKFDEAETLSKRVLAGREEKLGANHPNTLRSVWNLARVYSHRGAYDLADALYTRALTGQEEQLGPAHPFTLKTVRDVAQLRCYQGRPSEAQVLFENAHDGLAKALGPTHPNALRAASGLANVLLQQGEFARARQLFDTTLSSQQARLRPDHPDTLRTLRDYGRLQHRLGNVEEGHRMLTDAYAGLEKALGPKHPDLSECEVQLTNVSNDRWFDQKW